MTMFQTMSTHSSPTFQLQTSHRPRENCRKEVGEWKDAKMSSVIYPKCKRLFYNLIYMQDQTITDLWHCGKSLGKQEYSSFAAFCYHTEQSSVYLGNPKGSAGKESPCNAGNTGDMGSTPQSGRPLGGENGNPLQHPCLRNAMDRGAWQAIVH